MQRLPARLQHGSRSHVSHAQPPSRIRIAVRLPVLVDVVQHLGVQEQRIDSVPLATFARFASADSNDGLADHHRATTAASVSRDAADRAAQQSGQFGNVAATISGNTPLSSRFVSSVFK